MIIDAHAHAFPYVANKGVYASEADHLRHLQRHMTTHPQGGRRFRDNGLASGPTLWDGKTPGFGGLLDVDFRVGPYGRFEWEKDGERYYIQFFPVSLEVMEAKPERMLAQMQYIGVDKAMLQFAKMYGLTNEYLSDCVRRWPHKFRACTAVDEDEADRPEQIDMLRRAVRDQGLTALYFECNGYGKSNYENHLDDAKYNPFWEEVQALGIPVLWDIRVAVRRTSHAAYMEEVARLHRLTRRFPRIRHVLTHGMPSSAFNASGEMPEELWAFLLEPTVTTELLFPILYGSTWEYPYSEAQPIIRKLFERLGPHKLIWGADMPNIERSCTYAQSLNYLRKYCTFIPGSAMDRILGTNADELYFSIAPAGAAREAAHA
ncbi:MAG TPA: amidohydrolase family protein [Burkholderiales bacterium]|nr:amidohydrolase family protein [Burkholderiales bacterium]